MIEKIKAFFAKLFQSPYVIPVRKTDCDGNEVGCTILCPHCETWSHELNHMQRDRATYEDVEPISEKKAIYTCGKCLQKSEWFTGAPMPIAYSDVRKVE